MTDVHDAVKTVEDAAIFTSFREENPDAYLVHCFSQVKQGSGSVEIGYYDKSADLISVFTTNPVTKHDPEKVFKESGTLQELNLAAVKIGLSEVRKLAAKRREEQYPTHPVGQEICILQQHDEPVWNLTLVTETLNMYNLLFSAVSGELVSEDMRNILDLRKQ